MKFGLLTPAAESRSPKIISVSKPLGGGGNIGHAFNVNLQGLGEKNIILSTRKVFTFASGTEPTLLSPESCSEWQIKGYYSFVMFSLGRGRAIGFTFFIPTDRLVERPRQGFLLELQTL